MILVIDKKTLCIRYSAGSLCIEKDGKKIQRVPIKQLGLVVLYGNPLAEVNIWRYLSNENVPVAILASRGSQNSAVLTGSLATQLPFRRLQHKVANNPKLSLQQASYFVQLKLKSYSLSLTTLRHYFSVKPEAAEHFIKQQQHTLKKTGKSGNVAQLMGLEGQLAQAWFDLLAKSLPDQWKFSGRNRRPPRDPVNALLSLGYTLTAAEIHQLIIASGLDPSLGFLHQDTPGRESLVLDFTELFRAGVDSFVLQWLAQTKLDESSFYYREQQGCRLSKSARPMFYNAWSAWREQWPRAITSEPITDIEQWPNATLREQITGQIMVWREQLKDEKK